MSRTRSRLREHMANQVRQAVAQRKLEPEHGSKLEAALHDIFHAQATKDSKALDKAIFELCKELLQKL